MAHNHQFSAKFLALPANTRYRILKGHLARMESGEDPRADLIECVKYDIEQVRAELEQEMLDDAVVIYKLPTHIRE